jgi:hypothetical protein
MPGHARAVEGGVKGGAEKKFLLCQCLAQVSGDARINLSTLKYTSSQSLEVQTMLDKLFKIVRLIAAVVAIIETLRRMGLV